MKKRAQQESDQDKRKKNEHTGTRIVNVHTTAREARRLHLDAGRLARALSCITARRRLAGRGLTTRWYQCCGRV